MPDWRSTHPASWNECAGRLLGFGSVVLLAFADGGYFSSSWWPAIVAFASSAALAFVVRGGVRLTRAQFVVIGAFLALVAWTALSTLWSPVEGASLPEARRTLVYATLVLAAAACGGRLLQGVLAGVAVVCAYAVGERLAMGPPSPPDVFQGTLLQEPIGYANGLGALAAIGLSITFVFLLLGPRRLPYGALVLLFAVTLALTGSRAGWLASVAGVAVGAALALGARRVAEVLALLAAAALFGILALAAGPLATDLAERGGHRPLYWNVAWEEVAQAPVIGRGAGTFELAWLERQPLPVTVRDVHSLYLETLAELGVVGLVLLGLALLPPLLAGFRRRGASAGAATAGYVAYLLHTGVDWDWELPAVTVAGLLCGAALLGREGASSGDRAHLDECNLQEGSV